MHNLLKKTLYLCTRIWVVVASEALTLKGNQVKILDSARYCNLHFEKLNKATDDLLFLLFIGKACFSGGSQETCLYLISNCLSGVRGIIINVIKIYLL